MSTEDAPLALEAGFRLRVEDYVAAAAEAMRLAAERGGAFETADFQFMLPPRPEGDAGAAWTGYVRRLADDYEALLANRTRVFTVRQHDARLQAFNEEWIPIRADQAHDVRAWGVAFEGPPPLIDDLERRAANHYLRLMLQQARGAAKVLNRRTHLDMELVPQIFPGLAGDALERLVLDVLNEHAPIARHAPLDEDVLEKTDLRVRYPDLDRKRGARVQVTLRTHAEPFEAKASKVRHREEIVFVSPYTLGREKVRRSGREETFDPVAAASRRIRDTFVGTLENPACHPLGPMAQLDPELRTLIQDYVSEQSRTTTSEMRKRRSKR